MSKLQLSRRQMLSALSILSLGGITKASADIPVKKATFVLVHGAWHGGWCWKKITPLLKLAGCQVFAPTLTGLGERSHLLTTDTDLNTHVQDIINVLEYEELKDVVLVGHSYGGMVISGVAEKASKRLSQLIYLDAYLPETGKSVNYYNKTEASPAEAERTNRFPVWGNPQVYGVTNKEDITWMSSRLGDQPYKTLTQSLQLTEEPVNQLKKTFVQLTEFPQFIEAAERAKSKGFSYYKLLSGGHDAMVSKPKELADIFLKLI